MNIRDDLLDFCEEGPNIHLDVVFTHKKHINLYAGEIRILFAHEKRHIHVSIMMRQTF